MTKKKEKKVEYIVIHKDAFIEAFVVGGNKEICRAHLQKEYEDERGAASDFRIFKIEKECKVEFSTVVSIESDHGKKEKK